jgi:hypothetical protein
MNFKLTFIYSFLIEVCDKDLILLGTFVITRNYLDKIKLQIKS